MGAYLWPFLYSSSVAEAWTIVHSSKTRDLDYFLLMTRICCSQEAIKRVVQMHKESWIRREIKYKTNTGKSSRLKVKEGYGYMTPGKPELWAIRVTGRMDDGRHLTLTFAVTNYRVNIFKHRAKFQSSCVWWKLDPTRLTKSILSRVADIKEIVLIPN